MKKLFATALLSILGLALGTDRASALGWDGCFGCCCRSYVEGHQYNAFSPYCIDGCRFKRCNLCHRCCFLPVWKLPCSCCDGGDNCCCAPPCQMPCCGMPIPMGGMPFCGCGPVGQ